MVQAFVLLGASRIGYNGHRDKAMEEVRLATNILNPEMLKVAAHPQRIAALQSSNFAFDKAGFWEGRRFFDSWFMADYQLVQARGLITNVVAGAAKNNQSDVVTHGNNALTEIGLALTGERKNEAAVKAVRGKEAEALAEAFILLAAAEPVYEGHRKTAMDKVRQAAHILKANALDDDGVQKAIQKVQDSSAALALSSAAESEGKRARKMISDFHLYQASAVIRQVSGVMVQNEQPSALAHVEDALREIELALSVR